MKRAAIVGATILVMGMALLWARSPDETGTAGSSSADSGGPAAETLPPRDSVEAAVADDPRPGPVESTPAQSVSDGGAGTGASEDGEAEAEAEAGPTPPAPTATGVAAPPSGAVEGSAQRPDTDAILRRSSAAYEGLGSLRASFTMRLVNRLLGNTTESAGTLFQVNPDRFLMRFSEPAGDLIVSDGRHFWLYYPSVDARQVIRSPAGPGGAGAVDLRAQFIGDATRRFEATYEGREAVAGRPAHVLTLVPRVPAGYATLKVWVDREDHLVRRFEIREENGNLRRVELRDLQRNPVLDAALFEFEPPADARIIDRG